MLFITHISYAENVTVEGNLGDNDHELEGSERTQKTHFKKLCISGLRQRGEGRVDRKSIAKEGVGGF